MFPSSPSPHRGVMFQVDFWGLPLLLGHLSQHVVMQPLLLVLSLAVTRLLVTVCGLLQHLSPERLHTGAHLLV